MTDRDYFAAAALTRGMGVLGYEQIAKSCYEMADAMIRERERTNHDAVPAARAEKPDPYRAVAVRLASVEEELKRLRSRVIQGTRGAE